MTVREGIYGKGQVELFGLIEGQYFTGRVYSSRTDVDK